MKADWKYVLYIALAVTLFAVIKLTSPKHYDWKVTFSPQDKNPYGGYVLSKLMPGIFSGARVKHSFETLYEIKDSLKHDGNLFIVCTRFNCDESDTKALLKYIEAGGTAFISAQYFGGKLTDTLEFHTSDYFWQSKNFFNKKDTAYLRFVAPTLDTVAKYRYRRDNIHNYFSTFDTTRTRVIARNDLDMPVTVRMQFGEGNLFLNSTPVVFTNIYMLTQENHGFVSSMLSYLPIQDVLWSEYYQFGRMEIRTPLRFILTTEPLRWGYYITMVSLLLFMVFEMKRRQRIIPVLKPLENSTLEFVSTIGNLYYQNKEHRNIAEKKILFLFELIRTKYFLSTTKIDKVFIESLSKKSGKPESQIQELFDTILAVRQKKEISHDKLITLNQQIEKCNL